MDAHQIAAALAMRAACAQACEDSAPAQEADGYRQSNDHWRAAARLCLSVDPVAALSVDPVADVLLSQEAFEIAAKALYFDVKKRDNGEYFYPITVRAYKLWQLAQQ